MNWTEIISDLISAGSAIAVAYLTFHLKKDNANNREANTESNNKVVSMLRKLQEGLRENDLKTSRIDLRQALTHSRDDIPAMLELAQDYFVDKHGDADLGPKFLYWVKEYKVGEWAEEHGKDISEIINCAKHKQE